MLWKGLMRCCSSSHTKNKSGEREKKNGKVTSYYYKRRINICTRGVA